jgi:branched-chain amino acid transport system ATP-binding protein
MTKKKVVTYELPKDVILDIRNLSMTFGGLKAVDNLSFQIKKNQIFGLIGPNGAGKTTVFNCVTQFYKSALGEIIFENKNGDIINLNDIPVDKVINQGLVRTFQNVELIKDLTILENVLVGAHIDFKVSLFEEVFRVGRVRKEEIALREKALEVLKFLGIDALQHVYAFGLPYGISKKVELARTLMSNPKLIILDEPAAGLNDAESVQLAQLIKEIKDKYQCSILLVEHDMRLVMDVCDQICAISFGKLLEIGSPKEIQRSKIVQEAYLGRTGELDE